MIVKLFAPGFVGPRGRVFQYADIRVFADDVDPVPVLDVDGGRIGHARLFADSGELCADVMLDAGGPLGAVAVGVDLESLTVTELRQQAMQAAHSHQGGVPLTFTHKESPTPGHDLGETSNNHGTENHTMDSELSTLKSKALVLLARKWDLERAAALRQSSLEWEPVNGGRTGESVADAKRNLEAVIVGLESEIATLTDAAQNFSRTQHEVDALTAYARENNLDLTRQDDYRKAVRHLSATGQI